MKSTIGLHQRRHFRKPVLEGKRLANQQAPHLNLSLPGEDMIFVQTEREKRVTV